MAAGREIERKFLVGAPLPFDIEQFPSQPISQGYVAIGPDGTEVRIRAREQEHFLTVKSGPSQSRVEEELEIEPWRFESLWPLTEGRRIEKRRYVLPAGDELSVELDIYAGELEGLVTAEVEFPSEQAARAYEAPPWLGREVTGDADYSNQSLATRGRPS